MKKLLQLVDEHGIRWSVMPGQPRFTELAKLKLDAEEYACWRMHHLTGYKGDFAEEARAKLEEITDECLAAQAPSEALLESLTHAARAYATATALDSRLRAD